MFWFQSLQKSVNETGEEYRIINNFQIIIMKNDYGEPENPLWGADFPPHARALGHKIRHQSHRLTEEQSIQMEIAK